MEIKTESKFESDSKEKNDSNEFDNQKDSTVQNKQNLGSTPVDLPHPKVKISSWKPSSKNASNPNVLVDNEKNLRYALKHGWKPSEALILFQGVPIMVKGTMILIQGKKGSHKSRLGIKFIISLLKKQKVTDSIGFQNNFPGVTIVVYINTEMADNEEFLPIIRKIYEKSGIHENDINFRYSSLHMVPRKGRIMALYEYIKSIRENSDKHLVVFIDVVTDLISDFNNVEETNKVMDFLNYVCSQMNCTILSVIHENPGSEKARGNLGTEFGNKASTQFGIRIQYPKSLKRVITLESIKIRGQKPVPNIYMEYSEAEDDLVLCQSFPSISAAEDPVMAKCTQVCKLIPDLMFEDREYSQAELLDFLKEKLSLSENTLKDRLKSIISDEFPIIDLDGLPWLLKSNTASGKKTTYHLEPQVTGEPEPDSEDNSD
ncbi:MAG: hypothetical protein U0V04_17175 [Spirosomataceae bacterium]|jgi:hypothetical protein